MYREKTFRVRELSETLEDISLAGREFGGKVSTVFVADGDALIMDLVHWEAVLSACREAFPRLRRVSCYAMASNILGKSAEELAQLKEWGLSLLYIGPETGDDDTFKRIAKGGTFADHFEASKRARAAGLTLSTIFLLGAGGVKRSHEHAEGAARLITAMDPRYVSLLTLTVVPGTPIAAQQDRGTFELPSVERLLGELRIIVELAEPTNAVFRTNHASNYLPLGGRLPRDRKKILEVVDQALAGGVDLRPEWSRGL